MYNSNQNKMGKFEKAYKYKFVPVIITGIVLIIVSVLKYALQVEVGKFFGWSIFLTVAAFIYYRALEEQKQDRAKKESAKNAPPPSKEELQKKYEDEMQGHIDQQITNIGFRSFYLLMGIMILLSGITSVIYNKEYKFGGGMIAFGIFFIIHSIFLLRKWITYLKIFKQEKKRKIFDNETVATNYQMGDFGGVKPVLYEKEGQLCLILDMPPFEDNEGNEINGDDDFPELMEFEHLIAEYIGVPVIRQDREIFIVNQYQADTAEKIKYFLENYWTLRKDKYKLP